MLAACELTLCSGTPLGLGNGKHTQESQLTTLVLSDDVPVAWAGLRRAASSSYQTFHVISQTRHSLHPRSPKLVCLDATFFLACLASVRPWRALCGSGQQNFSNFPKTIWGVFSPPPHAHQDTLPPQNFTGPL